MIECIQDFRSAGMKVWILTGDKKETAESIAKTCGVLNSDMKICYIDESNIFNDLTEATNKIIWK